MPTLRKIRDAADARDCLKAVAQSRLSLAEWCQDHAVDGRSLNMWKRNLESRTPRPIASAPMRLVELIATEPVGPARYVVRCGRLAVEIDEGFDEDVLRRLLAVVASC